jgi:site-specific recombinase XerD
MFRVHDLRHTFASHLVSSGQSLHIVGKLLGHTQEKTTARYAHLAGGALREAVEQFAGIVTSGSTSKKRARAASA